MKLTAILLTVFAVHVMAGTSAQTISYKADNASLKQVFAAIKKQTGYLVAYNAGEVSLAKPVSVNAKDEPLAEFLNKVLKGQGLEYSIEGKTVVVSRKKAEPKAVASETPPASPPPIVRGRITNEKGEPVAGVSIAIKGGKVIGVSNDNGEFVLNNVTDNATLVFSAVTIETFETKLNGRSELVLSAKIKVSQLEDVVVNKGYYSEKEKLSTGNVVSISAKEIEKQPVQNPLLALQGRVPGLVVTQKSGLSGGGVGVRIQGTNSIGFGSDPLYVINGVPYTSQLLPSQGFSILQQSDPKGTEAGYGNPMNYINPSDIESIEILKDADATSIYGSRAANGAILITTKKGIAGQNRLDVSAQYGWGKVTRFLDVLNTQQYVAMRREAKNNYSLPVLATDYDINGTWDTVKTQDWQKQMIGNTAKYKDLQVSFSGGNLNTRYLVGTTLHNETTVFPGSLGDNKASFNFNISNNSKNDRLKLQFTLMYMRDENKLIESDLTSDAVLTIPNAPNPYNLDGTLNWGPVGPAKVSTFANPFASLERRFTRTTRNLIANALLEYKVFNQLNFKLNIGYNTLAMDEVTAGPLSGVLPENRSGTTPQSSFSKSLIESWIAEPQLSYAVKIKKSKIEALVGSTFQENSNNRQAILGRGYVNDLNLENLMAAATVSITNNLISKYKYNGVYFRANYNYLDRYVINLTARRDGSSRFGIENRFHNFGSIGTAWIFTNESFLKNNRMISFGKIRASYGTTGSDQIGDYRYLNLYSPVSVSVPYLGVLGSAPTGLPNPYLQWEETRKLQLGTDLRFFNDQFLLSINYYSNTSSNQLLGYTLPSVTGFGSITRNFPAVIRNKGLEISASANVALSAKMKWTSSLTLSSERNKLVRFDNLDQSSYVDALKIGRSITEVPIQDIVGVDPATGYYLFRDRNGNVVAGNKLTVKDRLLTANPTPNFYGGWNNSIRYKSIQLDIYFQFSKQEGNAAYLVGGTFPGSYYGSGASNTNLPATLLNRWTKPGDAALYQKVQTGSDFNGFYGQIYAQTSKLAWLDASYIRLKNLSLSWQIPPSVFKSKIESARLFVHAQNLFTITSFPGLDPETKTLVVPPLRVITIGAQLSL